MPTSARIFISCVSDEFGNYRDAIRKDLTRPNLDTKIQEDFISYGGATLEKLDDYIKYCEAVIHIAGDMTGSMANELSIQYIVQKYPDFGARFPAVQPVLKNETALSYTQWEAYLAAYHGKRLFVVTPSEKAIRNVRYKKDNTQAALQLAHLDNLRTLGYYNEITFSTEDELVKKLYQSKLGDLLNAIPKNKAVNLPYKSIGNSFKGREIVLQELDKMFSVKTNGAIAIAVHGLGGMGKTRLAVEYAWQHQQDYTALLFITAASPALLKANIANLSDPRILDLPEREQKEEDAKYAAVINWLNQYSGWLLIIDNVDTEEAAEKVEDVFAELQQGCVLITTRIDTWSIQVRKKRLDVLSKDDARDFLLETTIDSRAKTKNDNELATSIAADLGYLALALEQARAYIVTGELSFEKYRKDWMECQADVLSWFDARLMQYPASVAITWQTSFSQLSGSAITLLNRLAWLATEPIPKTMLEAELPDTENIDAQSAWEELKKYSLTSSTDDRKAFTIHKLVQDVTQQKMGEPLQLQALSETTKWINEAFDGDATNVYDWPVLEPLIPHVLSLASHSLTKEIDGPITRLMSDVALIAFMKAQYGISEQLMRRALAMDEKRLGPNDPDVAVDLSNLAQLLKVTNRFKEAEPLMRKALAVSEQALGPKHPDVAIRLNNLAGLLADTNRLKDAEPLIRRALEIDEQNFGPNHPNVSIRLNNLAQLLQDTNRTKEAEPLMRRALKIDEDNFGPDHPKVAIRLNNLSLLLKDTNRLQEAEPLMRRTLEIDEKTYGPDHPDVAADLNNLAQVLKAANRLKEAEPLMRRALDIAEKSFGPNHSDVATNLNNLSQLLKATNRIQEAEPLMIRALQIDEQNYGTNHPKVAIRLNNLAQLFNDTGRGNEAEPLMRKALEIDEQSFGPNHPSVAVRLSNLGLFLQDTGRLQEAEELIKRSLEIDMQSFGPNHPEFARDLNNLGQLFMVTDRLQDAERFLKQAVLIFYTSLGPEHPSTVVAFSNYSTLLTTMGKSREEIRDIILRLFA